jgi:hypothetical protein
LPWSQKTAKPFSKSHLWSQALQAEMSAPTRFKGRLNELLSQVRLQAQASALSGSSEKYNMDPLILGDIRNLLRQQQDGLQVPTLQTFLPKNHFKNFYQKNCYKKISPML